MDTIIFSSSKNVLWVEFFPFWSNLHVQDLHLITPSIEKEIPVFEICLEFWNEKNLYKPCNQKGQRKCSLLKCRNETYTESDFIFFRLNRVSYPEELRRFIERTESLSTSGNPSKGEDMDTCLEEVNKESKTWQHGTMTAMDYLRIFRNLENLTQVNC